MTSSWRSRVILGLIPQTEYGFRNEELEYIDHKRDEEKIISEETKNTVSNSI